jgi:hypothetical protein
MAADDLKLIHHTPSLATAAPRIKSILGTSCLLQPYCHAQTRNEKQEKELRLDGEQQQLSNN